MQRSVSTQTIIQEVRISDISLILRSAEFAALRHRRQRRKGNSQRPYIGHCIEVARLIAEIGGVEDARVISAAILHDTVEDTAATRAEIRREFGAAIDDIVAEVTDDKALKKKERRRLQIEHAPHLSHGAKLIKLADKISNVREIGLDPPEEWDTERQEKYFAWAKQVTDAMGSVNPALERRFAEVVSTAREGLRKSVPGP